MSHTRLRPYVELLESFLQDRVDANAFERAYLDLFTEDETDWPENEFLVLDELFADVDAFCDDPDLRDPGDLDETQLRERVRVALDKLTVLERGGV
jgi:hypothetical protein